MKRILLASVALAFTAACASTPATKTDEVMVAEDMMDEDNSGTVETIIVEKTDFDRAMDSVDVLIAAGNEQTAIDRLTQLLGKTNLTDTERQTALFKRGSIRFSDRGYDTWGAIADFEEIVDIYGDDALDGAALEMRDTARGKATSLNFMAQKPESTRVEKFQAMFDLGDHQEAIDLMLATNLNPGNDHLIAMYQIGYLCEGDGFTGPVYNATEPDGTDHGLQFCDFGK